MPFVRLLNFKICLAVPVKILRQACSFRKLRLLLVQSVCRNFWLHLRNDNFRFLHNLVGDLASLELGVRRSSLLNVDVVVGYVVDDAETIFAFFVVFGKLAGLLGNQIIFSDQTRRLAKLLLLFIIGRTSIDFELGATAKTVGVSWPGFAQKFPRSLSLNLAQTQVELWVCCLSLGDMGFIC